MTTTRADDAEMIVKAPLELRDLVVSVVLMVVAVIAVIVPGAVATMIALLSVAGLLALRLAMLHAGWPPRGVLRARETHPAITST